ncbi:MAG: site-specific integrase [Oscillospiraceae bacterium]|nr:site-specific integrase [Oscillospiraceae bacterium]
MYKRKDGYYADEVNIGGRRKAFVAKSKPELKRKIAEWSASQAKGVSFASAADAWDKYHAAQVTYNANAAYQPSLKRAKAHFEGRYLKDITPDEIQAFIKEIAGRGYARRTVQLHLDMLRMICDYAITRPGSVLVYNPCGAVRIPSGLPQKRREPPTDEQLAKILPRTGFGLFAYFLLYTGLRRGELLALKWEDIDREAKTISIKSSVYYEGNQPKIKEPKTDAGTRTVDLLDVLAAALPESGTGYIFGGEAPLTKIQVRKRWITFCRDAGLVEVEVQEHTGKNKHKYTRTVYKPTVTPHQFRHAYASMLDDAGIDEMGAKTVLGHSSIVVTKDIYTHLRARKRERIGGALNAYLAARSNDKTT